MSIDLIMSIALIKENGFTIKKKMRGRQYPIETMTDADYANTPVQAESLLHCLEQTAGGISLYVNINKTDFMNFKQGETISTWSSKPLKLVDQFA